MKPNPHGAPTDVDAKSKPKRVYRTKYDVIVIVQSLTERLTGDQCMEALQEALGKAATGTVDSGE